jgi:hypothetical protein
MRRLDLIGRLVQHMPPPRPGELPPPEKTVTHRVL